MTKLIIGCGTGRCGSTSLSKLFESCNNTHVAHYCIITHEATWTGINIALKPKYIISISPNHIDKMTDIILKYPDVKIICLKRNQIATVNSFLNVGTLFTIEELMEMWEEYYQKSEILEKEYPDNFQIFDVEILNSEEGQKQLFSWAEIKEQDRYYMEDCWFNHGE